MSGRHAAGDEPKQTAEAEEPHAPDQYVESIEPHDPTGNGPEQWVEPGQSAEGDES